MFDNEFLKKIREERNLSQHDLALAIGATKDYVWKLEAGGYRKPSLDFIQRLARYFDVSVKNFIKEEKEEGSSHKDPSLLLRSTEGLTKKDMAILNDLIGRLKNK